MALQRLAPDGMRPAETDAAVMLDGEQSTFFNRELSLIEYHWRLVGEVKNAAAPLLERVKMLAICDSNTDELFMTRVSGLLGELEAGVPARSPDGRTPAEQLEAIGQALRPQMAEFRRLFRDVLLPELAAAGIRIVSYAELTRPERQHMDSYFEREIFPVCTPLAIDPSHPFPFISNLSLNLAVVLRDVDGTRRFARLKVPPSFPRLVRVEGTRGREVRFIWIEDLIRERLTALFPELAIEEASAFRVLRDADFDVREIEAGDLLEWVRAGLQRRRFGEAVALEIDVHTSPEVCALLSSNLSLSPTEVYPLDGPLGLTDLWQLHELDHPELKDPAFVPRVPASITAQPDIFSAIRQGDILLHHPFDSFDPVIAFIEQAAKDPDVLAIKQTLYRIGLKSPIAEALRSAVDNGKQVAVLLELKARFDEENNIGWAEELERAGVHVTYGFAELKTHCKVALVVRREAQGIRRYVHIGTGNYNRSTARLYTDLGLFTCREEIGEDASDLFNFLTGYSHQSTYRSLLVAPVTLREGLRDRIEREVETHRRGGGGHLIFKMNSLVDPRLIQQLYAASQAGVRVDLIVRGVCCLRPGVPGLSEGIRVVSLVGRFLEHSRVYWFHNGGDEEVLLGSADLMPRNLDYRVEVLVPVDDAHIREQLTSILRGYLCDTVQSHDLRPDGGSSEGGAPGQRHDMQRWLVEHPPSALDHAPWCAAEPAPSAGKDVARVHDGSSAR